MTRPRPAEIAADPDRVLGPAEAASFLRIHPATLRRLKAAGRISYVALGRGGYRRSDLIALRDSLTRRQPAPFEKEEAAAPRRIYRAPVEGWNALTGRPYGMTAEDWAALGLTRQQWEAQQPRQKVAR